MGQFIARLRDVPDLRPAGAPSANYGYVRNAGNTGWILAPLAKLADVSAAITAHEGAADPHPQYLTQAEGDAAYDPFGAGSGAVLLHEAASDPHAQYAFADKSRPATWVSAADLAPRSLADLGTRTRSLLTSLSADDHAQYALADKSRPSPWVSAADLSARSLADLGTRQHSALTQLDYASAGHTGFAGTGVANTFTVGPQTIQTGAAGNKGLIVKGASSQTANLQEWQDSAGAVGARITAGGNFSNTNGPSSQNERFGNGATCSSMTDDNTAIGNNASALGGSSTAVGRVATAGTAAASGCIAIGAFATSNGGASTAIYGFANGYGSIAIGVSSEASNSPSYTEYNIAIGAGAKARHTGSIALGQAAVTSTTQQLVLGSSGYPIKNLDIIGSSTGATLNLFGQSLTATRQRAGFDAVTVDNTDATRKYRFLFNAYDTAAREVLRGEANGTAAMIGFLGAAAVIRQAGTGETVGFTAGAGTGVNDDSTFTGNVGTTAYRISDIVKALKNYGLLAS